MKRQAKSFPGEKKLNQRRRRDNFLEKWNMFFLLLHRRVHIFLCHIEDIFWHSVFSLKTQKNFEILKNISLQYYKKKQFNFPTNFQCGVPRKILYF